MGKNKPKRMKNELIKKMENINNLNYLPNTYDEFCNDIKEINILAENFFHKWRCNPKCIIFDELNNIDENFLKSKFIYLVKFRIEEGIVG